MLTPATSPIPITTPVAAAVVTRQNDIQRDRGTRTQLAQAVSSNQESDGIENRDPRQEALQSLANRQTSGGEERGSEVDILV